MWMNALKEVNFKPSYGMKRAEEGANEREIFVLFGVEVLFVDYIVSH